MNPVPTLPLAVSATILLAGASPPLVVPTVKVPVMGQHVPAARPPRPAVKPRHPRAHHPLAAPLREVAAANRGATQEPSAQGFIDAAQVFPYAEGALYHVYTAPGRITDIALEPGEALGSVASGDTVRWMIGDTSSGSGASKRIHVLVKPFSAGLATSLIITTDRRIYHLALSSTSGAAIAALSWFYPQDALIAIRKAAEKVEAAAAVASGLDVEQLDFDYQLSGDMPDWRPLRAFDDGRQTFIEFPASIATGEAPPLFVLGAKGEAELVNYRMHGRFYVVDRLFDVAELRLGLKRQQVVRIARTGRIVSPRRPA